MSNFNNNSANESGNIADSHDKTQNRHNKIYYLIKKMLKLTTPIIAITGLILSIQSLQMTRIQTEIFAGQFDLSKKQFELSQDSEKKQLRAYLYDGSLTISVSDAGNQKIVSAQVLMINGGATPAYKAITRIWGSFEKYPLEANSYNYMRNKMNEDLSLGESVLYKDHRLQQGGQLLQMDNDKILQYIALKDFRFYIWGITRWIDAFNVGHYNEFCFIQPVDNPFWRKQNAASVNEYCNVMNTSD